jgi:hypothetical protein
LSTQTYRPLHLSGAQRSSSHQQAHEFVDLSNEETALDSALDAVNHARKHQLPSPVQVLRRVQNPREMSPVLLHARRDVALMRDKLRSAVAKAAPSVAQIKADAAAQLRAWGAVDPLDKAELSTLEQAMVALYTDFDAVDRRSRQFAAQAFAIQLKYSKAPAAPPAAAAPRINPMQEIADRLSALLPARPAPAAPKQWNDVVAALLGVAADDALASAFAARVAAMPPVTPDTVVHWRNQPTFAIQLAGAVWMRIDFEQRYVIFANLDPAHTLPPPMPVLLTARAALSPDWLVALKKVRWPASAQPPSPLE